MGQLLERSAWMISQIKTGFKRSLYYKIPWNKRFIALTGARGVGKTTMLLQYLKENYAHSDEAVYISLDDVSFLTHSLLDFAAGFRQTGGKLLVIDEVHKYPRWSNELKTIYDTYQDLQIIFTGSSILEIYTGQADLSRRMLMYHLQGLSFREFLELKYQIEVKTYTLQEILKRHREISTEIIDKVKFPLKYFKEYLQTGYYPFFVEDKEPEYYYLRINQIIDLILTSDLATIMQINYLVVNKLQKLLLIIAESVPFKPNISKIANSLEVNRETAYKYISLLEKAALIKTIYSATSGIHKMTKPDKILLENPNLFYALSPAKFNTGSIRETFFYNQLSYLYWVQFPKTGDFSVDDIGLFEIGGKNKTRKQIAGIDKAFVVADDIEIGFKNTIPLWLFGFLY